MDKTLIHRQLILTGVYWQADDRRFKDNYFSSEISRLILFFGQGAAQYHSSSHVYRTNSSVLV